eukprot:TRINITY_DN7886_c0_g1_i1.p1 TRINITY_DN7886_c0_g1~~TRINITY_DN7886_c0_g1_i1.p1  ORF type:complete len:627 (-),score=121.24 TRINITY_DN7886_c0_g1_i1:126-1931(-)
MSGYDTPSDNLYVMGLPLDIDEHTLSQAFEQYGMVVQCKVLPLMEGKTERHAFVRFATVDEATNCRNSVSGQVFPALQTLVNIRFAQNKGGGGKGAVGGWGKSDTGGSGGNSWNRPAPYQGGCNSGGGGGDLEAPCDNLYVSGLPVEVDEEAVRSLFGGYGTVVQCKVLPPKAGQQWAVALVRYQSEPEATSVKNLLNGNIPEGLQQPITIKYKAMYGASEGAKSIGKGQQAPTTSPVSGASSVGEEVPCDNLYMKGLPAGIDEGTLHQVFGKYGPVSSCRVLPSAPGASDSVALIRFNSVEVATWVKENLHGNVPEGFEGPIYIKYKTGGADSKGASKGTSFSPHAAVQTPPPRQPVAPTAYQGGGGGVEGAPSDNLYVTGLPAEVNDSFVKEVFGQYGTVLQVKVLPTRPGQNDTVALVRYATVEEATSVKGSLDGNIPEGLESPICVRYKTDSKGGGKADAVCNSAPTYAGSAGKGAAGRSGGDPVQANICTGKLVAQGFEDSGALPGGSAAASDQGSVYIAGLPSITEDLDLYRIFAPFGAIKVRGVKVLMNPDGTSKGIAFVNYVDPEAAAQAVSICNGAELPDGSILKVSLKCGR